MTKTQKQIVEDIERKLTNLEAKVDYKLQGEIDGIIADVQDLRKSAEMYVLIRDFKPYQDGVIWTIRIVVGAVIMAGLAFLFRKPQ